MKVKPFFTNLAVHDVGVRPHDRVMSRLMLKSGNRRRWGKHYAAIAV
jgi:hypothetical protein